MDTGRSFKRYAIYHLPGEPLAGFGAGWLGWDIVRGRRVPHPDGLDLDLENLTRRPRRYGLHATIKAPFRLNRNRTQADLSHRMARLCQQLEPIRLPGLALSRMGRFLILAARGDQTGLKSIAAQVVEEIDVFRAPVTEAERVRRQKAHLSPVQMRYLEKWGDPHVMEQFNFHVTLTGPLAPDVAARVETALQPILPTILPAPYQFDSLSLVGEDEEGRFHEIEKYPLGKSL